MILYHAIRRLFLRCLSVYAWELKFYHGQYSYWENRITGKRTAQGPFPHLGGHQPYLSNWLNEVTETRKKWEGL